MAKLTAITIFLDKEFNQKKIPDDSVNGLQVRCKNEVKKIGFAVDACLSTFKRAKKAKVDLLIVHHGIKWKKQKATELKKQRIEFLRKNKISLYAVHLPLDAHYKYGNNIELANLLNIKNPKKFAKYHGFKIGYKGNFDKIMSLKQIANILNKKLSTRSQILNFGKKKIKTIGVVSGGSGGTIESDAKDKLDCLVLGEINLSDYNNIKDLKLNVIIAGHYATETLGVKALIAPLKEKFNIQTIFIDNPTGI